MSISNNIKIIFLSVLLLISGVLDARYAYAADVSLTSGSSWVAPTGVGAPRKVTIEGWGGGGAGGAGNSSTQGAGGGGAGAYAKSTNVTIVPGTTYSYVLGSVGVGNKTGQGGSGGATSFNGGSGNVMVAAGGTGGFPSSGTGGGGAGGQVASCTYSGTGSAAYNGGNGGNGNAGGGGGGGGESASASGAGNGGSSATNGTGAAGGTGTAGFDGAAGGSAHANGGSATSTNYGAGGGGAGDQSGGAEQGGNGASGKIDITYTELDAAPTITSLNSPGDTASVADTTPTFDFTGTDANIDSIEYNIQIDDTSNCSSPILDKNSVSHTVFANPDNGSDTHPFNSGENIQYTVQGAEALTEGNTYYWRVRGTDPSGTNTYGAWSSIRSFTVVGGISGNVYTNEAKTTNIGANKTVALYVNSTSKGTMETDANGYFLFTGVTGINANDTIIVYLDEETENGSAITIALNSGSINALDIITDHVTVQSETTNPMTNTDLDDVDGIDAEDEDGISISSGALTIANGFELFVPSGETFAPGGNVSTSKFHLKGTFTASSYTLTLTGSGTGVCDASGSTTLPLCIDSGSTFTYGTSTVIYTGTSASTLEDTTYYNLSLTPAISVDITYTFGGAVTVNGDLSINPSGSSGSTLTVNLGGTLSLPYDKTISINASGSQYSNLNTTPNYTIDTGLLSIGAGGILTANASTIYLRGTADPVFTLTGVFNAGNSTVKYTHLIDTFNCGGNFTINHLASGGVAPVDKAVTYGTVASSLGGTGEKCWITQNLGATDQASSATDSDEDSAGWYWQFNRKQGYKHDGTTRTPNTAWITSIDENSNWEAANDPCTLELGSGWRLPTSAEWTNVNTNGGLSNYTSAYNSVLKLHTAGYLSYDSATLTNRGSNGYYWSSIQSDSTRGVYVGFFISNVTINDLLKSYGYSGRCIRDAAYNFDPFTISSGTVNFNNLELDKSGVTSSLGDSVTVTNNLTITAGTLDTTSAGYYTITTGNVSIASGATLSANSSTINVSGNWSNNGTFIFGTSTVNLLGIDHVVSGNTTFYNFSVPQYSFSCGDNFIKNHTIANGVAPVAKTVLYATVLTDLSGSSMCWIGQNLGATNSGISATDSSESAAGWYWQFNRKQGYKYDSSREPATAWDSTNDNTYTGWDPLQDPCTLELGNDWRLPTYTEWNNADSTGGWDNYSETYGSVLKLHAAGSLNNTTGVLSSRGSAGNFLSSTQSDSSSAYRLSIGSAASSVGTIWKSLGMSIRCLRDNSANVTSRTVTFTHDNITSIASGGSLTLTGNSGSSLLTLTSDTETEWYLRVDPSATVSVSYVTVSESNALQGKQIDASNGTNTDGGLNLNWLFTAAPSPNVSTTFQGVSITGVDVNRTMADQQWVFSDTSQTTCYSDTAALPSCGSTDFPEQDAEHSDSVVSTTVVGNTVVDNNTGKMWQRYGHGSSNGYTAPTSDANCYNGILSSYSSGYCKYNWQNALKYCADLNLDGYADWRLPNVMEITTIMNYGSYFAIPNFLNVYPDAYWTSTTYRIQTSWVSAWWLDFDDGYLAAGDKTLLHYVLCVRGQ